MGYSGIGLLMKACNHSRWYYREKKKKTIDEYDEYKYSACTRACACAGAVRQLLELLVRYNNTRGIYALTTASVYQMDMGEAQSKVWHIAYRSGRNMLSDL